MEALSLDALMKKILSKLKYGGIHPDKQTPLIKMYSGTIIMLLLISFILQAVRFYTHEFSEFSTVIFDLMAFSASYQMMTKMYTYSKKHKVLASLVDDMLHKFWRLDDSLTSEERNKLITIYRYTIIIAKVYTISINCTLYGYCFISPLRSYHNYIINMWVPDAVRQSTVCYIMILIAQFFAITISSTSAIINGDLLFLTFTVAGIGQLKLLKFKLLTIGKQKNDAAGMRVLVHCVEHHNTLFRYFHEMDQLFSWEIFHMFITTIVLGVFGMYAFLIEKALSYILAYISIIISVGGQLYMHCLLGQLILSESVSVADATYSCNWEDVKSTKIRLGLLLNIQRSHKFVKLSAGGFFTLSLENFTRLTRLMFSIFTLLLNVNNKISK